MEISQKILSDLHLSEFVALDIETTGLEYHKDDIIEFGAVRYVNGNPSETISFLINPGRPYVSFRGQIVLPGKVVGEVFLKSLF